MTAGVAAPARRGRQAAATGSQPLSPELSVLIPFFRDDPLPLVAMLSAQLSTIGDAVEIVLFDDGSGDPDLNRRIDDAIKVAAAPIRLIVSDGNRGRAAARNALAEAARAPWLLFLDADMRVSDGFLARHLEAIGSEAFDAAFAGYEASAPADERCALHVALARASDVRDASRRAQIGATAFCTSNLLVRAELMRAIPFDTGYVGWGWEDVDWAVSAARHYRLVHLDIPALHDGWQGSEELLDKFRQAAGNHARLLDKHPDLARLAGARAAALLGKVPAQKALRPLWAALARRRHVPMRLRVLALKLWRASWAAEALRR